MTHKPVKEPAVYPEPFLGKLMENIYKFKQKIIKAMEGNQIAEKDKVEVLRKHLRGSPRESISDDVKVKNIEAFGNPSGV